MRIEKSVIQEQKSAISRLLERHLPLVVLFLMVVSPGSVVLQFALLRSSHNRLSLKVGVPLAECRWRVAAASEQTEGDVQIGLVLTYATRSFLSSS